MAIEELMLDAGLSLDKPQLTTYLNRKTYGDKTWTARTREIFELKGKKAQLEVSTSKNDRGQLVTFASIGFINSPGIVTTTIFQDFNERLEVSAARCTEKAVSEQQARWVARWPELKDMVFEFYA